MAQTAQLVQYRSPFGAAPSQLPARRSVGPSPALARANAALEAAKGKLTIARKNTEGKGGNVEALIATVAGGAAAGALKAKMPLLPIVNVDSRIGAAAACIGAGMFVLKGKMGGWLVNIGGGIAATVVSDKVEEALTAAPAAA